MKVCNELIEAECNTQRSLRVDVKANKTLKARFRVCNNDICVSSGDQTCMLS